ncbi:phytoene/squalene synthase family protein [Rubritalea spongiae]|uniref:Phytoene/squalene synthase family protein n=1 Tax=Rubritalea spongiae TaxID=430797 RepID=A0ABW5E407_9BACT
MQDKSELGKKVLKDVSRSFYLSIRLLPRLMREPISVGYLLARASDTIADTAQVPAKLREACLMKFTPALRDKKEREALLEMISTSFVSYQTNSKEKRLLERLGDVYLWYDMTRSWAWEAIAVVLEHICAGQMHDIRHFGMKKRHKIGSAQELELYCYQVAGCVGEFWTEVGFQAYHRFSAKEQTEMNELGRRYGMGLQLVNILRDIPEDYENGRCYLPVLDHTDKEEIMRNSEEWRKKAREYVASGFEYSASLKQKRARVATVLPAMLAEKTLDLLDHADWEILEKRVKVDRKTVRSCVWQALKF